MTDDPSVGCVGCEDYEGAPMFCAVCRTWTRDPRPREEPKPRSPGRQVVHDLDQKYGTIVAAAIGLILLAMFIGLLATGDADLLIDWLDQGR